MSVPKLSAELTEVIVDVLREKRIGMELSKRKMAATAGISRTAIILMENRKSIPSLSLAVRLSMSMGMPFSKIVAIAEKRLARTLSKSSAKMSNRRSASSR